MLKENSVAQRQSSWLISGSSEIKVKTRRRPVLSYKTWSTSAIWLEANKEAGCGSPLQSTSNTSPSLNWRISSRRHSIFEMWSLATRLQRRGSIPGHSSSLGCKLSTYMPGAVLVATKLHHNRRPSLVHKLWQVDINYGNCKCTGTVINQVQIPHDRCKLMKQDYVSDKSNVDMTHGTEKNSWHLSWIHATTNHCS